MISLAGGTGSPSYNSCRGNDQQDPKSNKLNKICSYNLLSDLNHSTDNDIHSLNRGHSTSNETVDNNTSRVNNNHYARDAPEEINIRRKTDKVLRVFYNNCNSLEINSMIDRQMKQKAKKQLKKHLGDRKTQSKFEMILSQLQKWEVNVTCLSETSVAWEYRTPKKVIHQIAKSFDKKACISTSSSTCKSGSYYKPGGTLTMMDGNWSGYIVDKGSDPYNMGRWSYITIGGKRNKAVTIITAYRNSRKKAEYVGPTTAIAQQDIILKKTNRNVTTDVAFTQDMEKFVQQQLELKREIILALDANEEYISGSGIKMMAESLDLRNAGLEIYGKIPTTKPSTGRAIDHILCTNNVMQAMSSMVIPKYDILLGDHRGIIIDIDTEKLLHTSINEMNIMNTRKLTCSHVKAIKAYEEKLMKHFEHHKIKERTTRLQKMTRECELGKCTVSLVKKMYEKIDRDVFRLCKNAEKKCRRLQPAPMIYSDTVVEIRSKQYVLEMARRYAKSGKRLSTKQKDMAKQKGIMVDLDNKDDIREALGKIYERIEVIKENEIDHRAQFLQDLAGKYARTNNMDEAKAVEELMKHEKCRNTYRYMGEK